MPQPQSIPPAFDCPHGALWAAAAEEVAAAEEEEQLAAQPPPPTVEEQQEEIVALQPANLQPLTVVRYEQPSDQQPGVQLEQPAPQLPLTPQLPLAPQPAETLSRCQRCRSSKGQGR